jgi:hypothetical protein
LYNIISLGVSPLPVKEYMERKVSNSNKYLSQRAQSDLKQGLSTWASLNQIRPSDFARAMGYTPAYAWNLLRGSAPVTLPTVGLFLLRYGIKATSEFLELSGMSNHQNCSCLGEGENFSGKHQ